MAGRSDRRGGTSTGEARGTGLALLSPPSQLEGAGGELTI